MSGRERAGTAMGLQNTVLSAGGVARPDRLRPRSSPRPLADRPAALLALRQLAGVWVLRPLAARSEDRAPRPRRRLQARPRDTDDVARRPRPHDHTDQEHVHRAKFSRVSRASSPSPPRSPSPTRRAARSATAASTSRTSSATCPSRRSGACSSTARYDPGLPPAEPHPLAGPHRATRAWTSRPRSRMLAPEWGFQPADRHRRRAGARRPRARVGHGAVASWPSPRAASASRRCRRRRSTGRPRSPSAS